MGEADNGNITPELADDSPLDRPWTAAERKAAWLTLFDLQEQVITLRGAASALSELVAQRDTPDVEWDDIGEGTAFVAYAVQDQAASLFRTIFERMDELSPRSDGPSASGAPKRSSGIPAKADCGYADGLAPVTNPMPRLRQPRDPNVHSLAERRRSGRPAPHASRRNAADGAPGDTTA